MIQEGFKKGINGLIKAIIVLIVVIGVISFLVGKYLF
jgi:magnesium-transporting ATPase (P-type)